LLKTLVVSLFGGPGAGKSTFAHGIMWHLKIKGIECEFAAEYAKDVVFEENSKKLDNQIYIFGKQLHRVYRLMDKVEVVVTDSPILLSTIYDKHQKPTLKKLILEEYGSWNHLNYVIQRLHDYNPKGRIQDEADSQVIHQNVISLLNDNNLTYQIIESKPENLELMVNQIVNKVNELR